MASANTGNLNPENRSLTGSPVASAEGPRAARAGLERRFQQGLFAYHRGDYSIALKDLEKALETAEQTSDHARFVEICTYLLRILAEREEFARIERIESGVLALIDSKELSLRLKSRAMYILGICSCYQDQKHDQAMNRFRESIDFAVKSEDKEALASPLYGAASVLYARGRYDEALRELTRLEVLLECLVLPDISSAASFLRAMILRNQGNLDEALESAWKAYEALKDHPQLVLYMQTLCTLSSIYLLKGDTACAKLYIDLVKRSLKRSEFPRIARLVDDAMEKLKSGAGDEMDLVFDTRTGILIERVKGEVRFEGQFILRDLLRQFLENPGQVFTKSELTEKVWRESYSPAIHDNKIYVTIKRLRKLLESEESPTEYILRAKSGYYLNPKTRVLIDGLPVNVPSQETSNVSPAQ